MVMLSFTLKGGGIKKIYLKIPVGRVLVGVSKF